jgi:hypothetical protein
MIPIRLATTKAIVPPEAKDSMSKDILSEIDQYLANGGKIEDVPFGKSSKELLNMGFKQMPIDKLSKK